MLLTFDTRKMIHPKRMNQFNAKPLNKPGWLPEMLRGFFVRM